MKTWDLDETTSERLMGEAIRRQSAVFKTDLEDANDNAKTERQLRDARVTWMRDGKVTPTDI